MQPIAEFSIKGLYGDRNITIPFEDPVKILVAENGAGKTTVLNLLYSFVTGSYSKLRNTDFESLSIKFKSGQSVKISKTDLGIDLSKASSSGMFQHFSRVLNVEETLELFEKSKIMPRSSLQNTALFKKAQRGLGPLPDIIYQWVEHLSNELGAIGYSSELLVSAGKIIKSEFPFDIIYLPTYRRIEEDLKFIVDAELVGPLEKNVIQFGMHDVFARINEIINEIKSSSVQWFAKVNGQMLGQLVESSPLDDAMKGSLKDTEALRIILHRAGQNISQANREIILNMIETGDILSGHDALAYFLANLVEGYEQQKANDNAIKTFVARSNKYLVDKEVYYDENAVSIIVRRKRNEKAVNISTLSSGEKQILSLFSRLFLEKPGSVAIFFDEPELSLSIEWQKQLLPDIMDSGICHFLFCTTHSPFIFENNLMPQASGLDQYIQEI